MKLRFKRAEDEKTQVFQVAGDQELAFSYSQMIRSLIDSEPLDTPETSGEFTDEEKKSINSMVDQINQVMREDLERREAQNDNS